VYNKNVAHTIKNREKMLNGKCYPRIDWNCPSSNNDTLISNLLFKTFLDFRYGEGSCGDWPLLKIIKAALLWAIGWRHTQKFHNSLCAKSN
jgi:hypothetical protein